MVQPDNPLYPDCSNVFDKSFVYMDALSCRFQTVLARGITRQLRVNPDNVLYTPTVVGFFLCSDPANSIKTNTMQIVAAFVTGA